MRLGVSLLAAASVAAILVVAGTAASRTSALTPLARLTLHSSATRHFEYVAPDQEVDVYDADHGWKLVQKIKLPGIKGIRGLAANPKTHTLYVSFGGDGGENGNGSVFAYDLLRGQTTWHRDLPTGVDSMVVSPDGKRMYMPTGELSPGDAWLVLDARSGKILQTLHGGPGPHNTVLGLSGKKVYLAAAHYPYLVVANALTGKVIRKVGPMVGGVRPFAINGRETLSYTAETGFLGFQVGDLRTGKVLYTVPVKGFTWNRATFAPSTPSHGVSLSPNEREVYVVDAPNSYVHVFDVTGVPGSAPRQVADIKLRSPFVGEEQGCAYDCHKSGWVRHSLDGKYVYVGDSGDVISTKTRRIVATLPAMRNSRKMIEVDWRRGKPVAATSRYGIGHVR